VPTQVYKIIRVSLFQWQKKNEKQPPYSVSSCSSSSCGFFFLFLPPSLLFLPFFFLFVLLLLFLLSLTSPPSSSSSFCCFFFFSFFMSSLRPFGWASISQSVWRFARCCAVRGSNPGGGEIFRTRPDGPWGPPSLLYSGQRITVTGV